MLDFLQIMVECGLDGEIKDLAGSLKKVAELEDRFDKPDLTQIYSHILGNVRNPQVLMQVIKQSDKIRDKSILNFLLDVLLMKNNLENCTQEERDEYINARAMSAKAIANLKDTSAVTPLLYCLNNKEENYKIRLACADALGKIGDRYAVAPLIAVVTDQNERSVYVKESAAEALGIIGDTSAIEPLVKILEGNKGLLDKFTFLKERVIEALGKMKLSSTDFVFKALKNSLIDESAQIRICAIEAIMNSDHPDAVKTIRPLLTDKDEDVRKNALIAIYNINGKEILEEVISLPVYPQDLKDEAQRIIDEYECGEEIDVRKRQ